MRAWLTTFCCSLLCLTGCRSSAPVGAAHSRDGEGLPLSSEEDAFAKALAHYGQGLLYEAEEGRDSLKALSQLQAAAKADPGNHDLLSHIAVIALHRKDYAVAIEALERSYRYDPKSYERCVDLAAVYQAAEKREAAIAQYNLALRRDTSRAAVYVALAGLHFEADEDKQALRVLDRGKRLATKSGLVNLYTYEQAKRFVAHDAISRATPCFERLADWDEERRPQFYQLLGELFVAQEDTAAAIKVLTKATKLPAPLPEAFISLAGIYLQSDKAKGMQILQSALERLPNDPAILFALGCVHSDSEQYAEAIPFFEQAKRNATSNTADIAASVVLTEAFYLYQGAAYERTGQLEAAARIFEAGLELYPNSHRILNYLAYMLAESNQRLDQALLYINRALALQPDNPAYRDTLGWIYFRQGHFREALKQVESAKTIFGDDAEILHHLGDIHRALENPEKAVECWKRSFILDSGNATVADKLRQRGVDPDACLLDSLSAKPGRLPERKPTEP